MFYSFSFPISFVCVPLSLSLSPGLTASVSILVRSIIQKSLITFHRRIAVKMSLLSRSTEVHFWPVQSESLDQKWPKRREKWVKNRKTKHEDRRNNRRRFLRQDNEDREDGKRGERKDKNILFQCSFSETRYQKFPSLRHFVHKNTSLSLFSSLKQSSKKLEKKTLERLTIQSLKEE